MMVMVEDVVVGITKTASTTTTTDHIQTHVFLSLVPYQNLPEYPERAHVSHIKTYKRQPTVIYSARSTLGMHTHGSIVS